jgi:hypothetical protein
VKLALCRQSELVFYCIDHAATKVILADQILVQIALIFFDGISMRAFLTSVTSAADGSYTVLVGAGEHLLRAAKSGYEAYSDLLVAAPPAVTGVDSSCTVKTAHPRARDRRRRIAGGRYYGLGGQFAVHPHRL